MHGSWVLGLGSWVLGLGPWALGLGYLGLGPWVLGLWVFGSLGLGSWVLGLYSGLESILSCAGSAKTPGPLHYVNDWE